MKACEAVVSLFTRVLLEETHLAAMTRAYVSQVHGSPLQSVKRLFTEQQRQIDYWLLEISSRCCAPGDRLDGVDHAAEGVDRTAHQINRIVEQHEALAGELRRVLEELRARDLERDAVLLLSGLLEFHETSAWMLRVLLNSPERAWIR